MKTFKDLIFENYFILYPKAKKAREFFDNDFGISVLFGDIFNSNGIDNYEICVLLFGNPYHEIKIPNNGSGVSAEQISEFMIKLQKIK